MATIRDFTLCAWLSVSAVIVTSVSAAAADRNGNQAPPDFQVFNAMLYANMPPFGTRLGIIGESTFFPGIAELTDGLPKQSGLAAAVSTANWLYADPKRAEALFVAIDIERWPLWPFASSAQHEESVDKYGEVARRFKALSGRAICYYSVAPAGGIVHTLWSETRDKVNQEWIEANHVLAEELVPHVDALCPSLYTFYGSDNPETHRENIEGWKKFARLTMMKAREIAQGKPVYPFVWPQYHEGGNIKGSPYVDTEYWREQLKLLRKLADGIIVWGGWRQQWDPGAQWWRILREETGVGLPVSHQTILP